MGRDQSSHKGDPGAYSPVPQGMCLLGVKPGGMKGPLSQDITEGGELGVGGGCLLGWIRKSGSSRGCWGCRCQENPG